MNVSISTQNNWFLLFHLAWNTDLGQKKIGCMFSKWQFCATKLAKTANYACSSLVGKYMKIMLVNDELCQKYASKFC